MCGLAIGLIAAIEEDFVLLEHFEQIHGYQNALGFCFKAYSGPKIAHTFREYALGQSLYSSPMAGMSVLAEIIMDIHSLFSAYAKDLIRTLKNRGASNDVAADITQDIFVKLLTQHAKDGLQQPIANPKAYLKRAALNLFIDRHRRGQTSRVVDIDQDSLADIADATPSPEQIAIHRQRLEITQMALSELPERTRYAFEMHRLGEKNLKEIAAELNISTTRVWVLVREAYSHIKERLDEKLD